MKVKDAMTTDVKAVRRETSLKDVAAVLAEHGISGAPILDDEGRVIGVISEADILVKEYAELPHRGLVGLLHHREAEALATKVEARTAGEAMTEPAITIAPWELLSEAAALMIERGVNRLPVVEQDKLVGILTRADLVRAFARSDAEIASEIREEALGGLAFPEDLELTIDKGEVTLRGDIDTKYDAEALPATIRRIPGVVSVDAELGCWDPDAGRRIVVASQL
jgi:CBS domain-containing protein